MNHWWARAKVIGSLAALLGSFALSAVTWIGIGGITGYGSMRIIMPLVVDAYIVTAISIGMSTDKPQIARSAYYHALSAAIIGTVAQAVFHCASIWSETHTPWKAMLAFVGGGLPPSFAFLGVHLLGMDQQEMNGINGSDPGSQATAPTPSPPAAAPALGPPQPPESTPTAARPVSPEQPVTPPLPIRPPTTQPKPVSVPTVTSSKRNPRVRTSAPTTGRAFPQRLDQADIQVIYDGLAAGLSQVEIARRIGRSEAVVQKYAAIRREQLAQARNGKVSQR